MFLTKIIENIFKNCFTDKNITNKRYQNKNQELTITQKFHDIISVSDNNNHINFERCYKKYLKQQPQVE